MISPPTQPPNCSRWVTDLVEYGAGYDGESGVPSKHRGGEQTVRGPASVLCFHSLLREADPTKRNVMSEHSSLSPSTGRARPSCLSMNRCWTVAGNGIWPSAVRPGGYRAKGRLSAGWRRGWPPGAGGSTGSRCATEIPCCYMGKSRFASTVVLAALTACGRLERGVDCQHEGRGKREGRAGCAGETS
jgi:hypothetical protein